MRIWHQSFTVLSDLPAYADAMAERAAQVLREDTEIVFHGQLPGTYPSNYPGDDIGYAYSYAIHGNQWIAAALAAERDGFDAYAMCTLPNPMLREARTLVDIPVVGLGETVFHFAAMHGQRFGVMLFIDRMIPLYREQIRGYGLETRCGAIRPSGLGFADVLAGFSDPAPAIARFEAAARKLIAETDVDVIVPGEVPLNMLLACNGVNRVDDVPIMDSFATTLKTAEMLVELKRTTGLAASRHGWMNSAPDRERIDQILDFYGLDKLGF
jgi:Asp/Glu/hydantoin racemase